MEKIINNETQKIELHFSREEYAALDTAMKSEIKSNFLWSKAAGAWVSRCKLPNTWRAEKVAEKLGAIDGGKVGEKLRFAEQMERKADRAEARAERMEKHAENAMSRCNQMQKPINDMHGDISFFTQPNINSAGGRAFTNRRNKMFAAYERGFDEYRKSEYYKERAATARETAQGTKPTDKAFCDRRIKDCEKNVRAQQKNVEDYEKKLADIESGKGYHRYDGTPITAEQVNTWIENSLDRIESELDRMSYYQNCLEELGGVMFSKENIKAGYIILADRWGKCKVESTGLKNITIRILQTSGLLTIAYAEIKEIVSTDIEIEQHPFKIGDTYNVHRWNNETCKYEPITYEIVKTTADKVTIKAGNERAILRKPRKGIYASKDYWLLGITDGQDGTVYKKSE